MNDPQKRHNKREKRQRFIHWIALWHRLSHICLFLLLILQEYVDLETSFMVSLEPSTPTPLEPPTAPRNSIGTEHELENCEMSRIQAVKAAN